MSARVFEPLLNLIESRRFSINPDLPGYANSPWRFEPSFAAQVEQMGQALTPGRLLGWSMGGLYAIELAIRFPQKFSEVILIACNPCFVKRPDWDCAIDTAVLDAFATDLEQDWQRTLRRFLALQMQGEGEARAMTRNLWQQIVSLGNPDPAVLRFGLDLLKQQDLRAGLGQLTQPVKLILGDRDRLVPIALQQQIADVAPEIRVESLAGAAHAPFISNPAAVVGCL